MQNDAYSVSGQKWIYQNADENMTELLSQQLGFSYAACRVLAVRGIGLEEAQNFLDPKIKNLMPNPSCLKDMDKTAEFMADLIETKQQTGIIGDYDVDGATSSALLKRYLEFFGLEVYVHIPERDEGYGPSRKAFEEFESLGIQNVMTTDCGTTAFEVLGEATDKGFKVVVIDHHEAETKLPDVYAVVNPKRLDEKNDYPYLKCLAAVGVVFLTLVATNRVLSKRGFFDKNEKPDLMDMLDLVALGTVCDVVPLLGLNRAYVKQGLKVISMRKNVGLTTLIDNSGVHQRPTTYHLGFVLGPRINAGGRVGDSSLGNRLLCTNSEKEALEITQKLNAFNTERKDIEEHVLREAIEQIEKKPLEYPLIFVFGPPKGSCLYQDNWHQGVIGIVAGKLKERYHLPALVMSIEKDEVKGSARSVDGLDIGALIMCAKEKGLITKGGGHTMAAGFSVEENQIESFGKFVGESVQCKLPAEKLTPMTFFDVRLSLEGATMELAEQFELLSPFGADNPEPKVVIENVKIIKPTVLNGGHVRCFLGADYSKKSLKAVCFKCVDNSIGATLLNADDRCFDVLGTLRVDEWMNTKNLQLTIEDIMEKDIEKN